MPEPTSLITLLAIDIGTISTRAALFEPSQGKYQLTGVGIASTSLSEPFFNLNQGVHSAIEDLQAQTGRLILDGQKKLLKPAMPKRLGVDACVTTISAGLPLRVLALGLSRQSSLESVRRLARMIPVGALDEVDLTGASQPETIIDRLLESLPDLVIIAGGFDGGAKDAVLRLVDPVRMAFDLLPEASRPEILYIGNQILQPVLQTQFQGSDRLHCAANIRPAADTEQISPVLDTLAHIHRRIMLRQVAGLQEFVNWSGSSLLPKQQAFGRIIRFLSKENPSKKAVMGVDMSAAAAAIYGSWQGKLSLAIYPEYGLAAGKNNRTAQVRGWLGRADLSEEDLAGMLLNKNLFPASLPVTIVEADVSAALVRSMLRDSVTNFLSDFRQQTEIQPEKGDLPLEPILISGSPLAKAPTLGQACLAVLDGVQPVGITTVVVDKVQIAAMLGAAAEVDPLLAVQLFDTDAFLHLCTVVVPQGDAPPGTPVLRIRLNVEDEHEITMDIRQGELELIPLPAGKPAVLHLQPFHRYDVGMQGRGRGGSLKVTGSALGVVIDARGRPFQYSQDALRREEQYRKWIWTLGG